MKRWLAVAGSLLVVVLIITVAVFNRSVESQGVMLIERTQFNVTSAVEELWTATKFPDRTFVEYMVKIGLRLSGRTLTPGLYRVPSGSTQYELISMLVLGRREPLIKITFPEGFTMFQIASRLQRRAQIDSASFITWCTNDATRKTYGVTSPSMDGFLMPATYHIIRTEPAETIATMMADASQKTWNSLVGAGFSSRDSIITLASIVQKEAVREDEFSMIAGVYLNRLQRSMRLEADPTLQYGRDLAITRTDLRDVSNPYNTYQHAGLPPGPICNPGTRAIKAALRPDRHNFLFFVARGDASGGHRFGRTYAEHLINVRAYRAARAAAR